MKVVPAKFREGEAVWITYPSPPSPPLSVPAASAITIIPLPLESASSNHLPSAVVDHLPSLSIVAAAAPSFLPPPVLLLPPPSCYPLPTGQGLRQSVPNTTSRRTEPVLFSPTRSPHSCSAQSQPIQLIRTIPNRLDFVGPSRQDRTIWITKSAPAALLASSQSIHSN